MNISSVASAGQVDASAPQTVVVAKMAQNQQKQEGQNAVQLIQSAKAPPPPTPGQTISRYA